MKRPLRPIFCTAAVALLLAGCLATPVDRSGGPGAITVPNTNPHAIFHAAQPAFASYGYKSVRSDFPRSISFEKPAGRAGSFAFGGPMQTTSFRVRIEMVRIPGTDDFRLRPHVDRVNNANVAGFESSTRMLSLWTSQFSPILRQIKAEASNAGP